MLTHEFRPTCGGIAVYTEELARAACKQFEVEVWAPKHEALDEASFPFAVTGMPIKGTHNPGCVLKTMSVMRRLVYDNTPDVLCLAEPGPLLAAMFMQFYSKFPGNSIVIVMYGSEIQRFINNPFLSVLFKKLLRKVSRIGLISEYNRNKLSEAYPELSEKMCIVKNALRHDFCGDISKPEKKGDEIVLLTVGRVHPRKGQLVLVEAISQLPEAVRNRVTYQVVGSIVDASYRDEILEAAKKANLNLELIGEVEDHELGRYYENADIFALTSVPYKKSIEGFGFVYLEAGYYHLPSVAHRIGGVPEAVLDEKTGLLADPADRSTLVRAILRLIEDSSLRESLGENARQYATQHSWKDNVDVLFENL